MISDIRVSCFGLELLGANKVRVCLSLSLPFVSWVFDVIEIRVDSLKGGECK